MTVERVRYLNKNNNANERENYSRWWKEQIEHYGTRVDYYTHGYSLTSHNYLYGEDPTSRFQKTADLIMLTDITNDSLMLSKFGIMADCDMTAVIHISSFYEKFGCGYEPKAGDLIKLTEYGADRPGGRSAPIYEITERDDEFLTMTNPLIGHYVWYIKCKRYEYSFEPGVSTGVNNKQINDSGDYGRLGEGANPEELFQPYPDSVQNDAKCIYDYYDQSYDGLNTDPNHFIPPQEPTCASPLTSFGDTTGPYVEQLPFHQSDLDALMALLSSKDTLDALNLGDVLVRTLSTIDASGNKTFVIENWSKPDDDIVYTTNLSTVPWEDIFGG